MCLSSPVAHCSHSVLKLRTERGGLEPAISCSPQLHRYTAVPPFLGLEKASYALRRPDKYPLGEQADVPGVCYVHNQQLVVSPGRRGQVATDAEPFWGNLLRHACCAVLNPRDLQGHSERSQLEPPARAWT